MRFYLPVLVACLIMAGVIFPVSSAMAACSNPVRDEGTVIYNDDHDVVQFCNGSDQWVALGSSGGSDTLSGLTCGDGQVAKWNNTGGVWECAADNAGSGGDDLGDHTATQALDMASNKITNVTDPTAAQDAATKAYVDAAGDDLGDHTATQALDMASNSINNAGNFSMVGADFKIYNTTRCKSDGDAGTDPAGYCDSLGRALVHGSYDELVINFANDFDGGVSVASPLSMNSNKITDVADPTAAQDAATKAYVDANAGGGWPAPAAGTIRTPDAPNAYSDSTSWDDSARLVYVGTEDGTVTIRVRFRDPTVGAYPGDFRLYKNGGLIQSETQNTNNWLNHDYDIAVSPGDYFHISVRTQHYDPPNHSTGYLMMMTDKYLPYSWIDDWN